MPSSPVDTTAFWIAFILLEAAIPMILPSKRWAGIAMLLVALLLLGSAFGLFPSVSRALAWKYSLPAFVLIVASLAACAWAVIHRVQSKSHSAGLSARLRGTHTQPHVRFRNRTKVFFHLDLFNSGRPSVATDWEFFIGRRRIARAYERKFEMDGSDLDPSLRPINEGHHAYGTVSFDAGLSESELKKLRKRWHVRFQDAARRKLLVEDDGRL